MEKVDKLVKKRNLEGNSSTANKFSALPIEEIAHTVADMGISIKHDDFATFDLLKTLEMARGGLYLKQCEQNESSKTDTFETQPSANEPLQLEWLCDQSSDV